MKKDQRNILIVAIAIILLIGWLGGFFTQYGAPPPNFPNFRMGGQQPDVIFTDVDKENYKQGIGRFHVYETVVNSLDIATERTTATNYKIYWYTRQGTQWIYHETGDDKYVTLTEADAGVLWVVLTIPTSQAFYVDYQKIVSNNQYINSYLYQDIDGDGVKEFAFPYDMKNQPIPNSGYPAITFMGFTLTYEASFTGLNDLANETAIGTAAVTKFKDYYLSFATAKSAVAIYKVEVKITTTDETKIRLKKLNIPRLGYLDGSSFSKAFTASDIRYTYTIASNFDGCVYLAYAANTQNRFDMTLGLEYTLAGSDDILVTLTVYYLVAQTEAGTSTSDTFYAQES